MKMTTVVLSISILIMVRNTEILMPNILRLDGFRMLPSSDDVKDSMLSSPRSFPSISGSLDSVESGIHDILFGHSGVKPTMRRFLCH